MKLSLPTVRYVRLSDFCMLRSNLQQRSTANCGTCMDPTLRATVWSVDGAGNSLRAQLMCTTMTVVVSLSLVMPELMESVQQAVLQNRHFTIWEI